MIEATVDGEVFRQYDHLFSVSRSGRILKGIQLVIPNQHPQGYLAVGHGSRRLVHRMVALCWLDKPERAHHVHHINGNKSDNRAENLLWVTPKEHFVNHHKGNGVHQVSDATKQRLRDLRLGTKQSEETKAKKREASLRLGCKPPPRPVGYKCSDEAVKKMQDNHVRNTSCEVDGVSYRSYSEAARILGIRPLTLRKRCLSAGFPNYRKR